MDITYEEFFDSLFKKYELEIHKTSIRNSRYQLNIVHCNQLKISNAQSKISDAIWLIKGKSSYVISFFLPTDLDNALTVYFTSCPIIKLNAIRPALVKLIKQEIGRQIAECFDSKHDTILYCGNVKMIEATSPEEAIIQLDLKDGIEV